MKYSIFIPDLEKELIRYLSPDLKRKMRDALDEIVKGPSSGKDLIEELAGLKSYRVGRFRIVYRVKGSDVEIIKIGSRKDIYQRVILELKRSAG